METAPGREKIDLFNAKVARSGINSHLCSGTEKNIDTTVGIMFNNMYCPMLYAACKNDGDELTIVADGVYASLRYPDGAKRLFALDRLTADLIRRIAVRPASLGDEGRPGWTRPQTDAAPAGAAMAEVRVRARARAAHNAIRTFSCNACRFAAVRPLAASTTPRTATPHPRFPQVLAAPALATAPMDEGPTAETATGVRARALRARSTNR